jgi:hypothetical protein
MELESGIKSDEQAFENFKLNYNSITASGVLEDI